MTLSCGKDVVVRATAPRSNLHIEYEDGWKSEFADKELEHLEKVAATRLEMGGRRTEKEKTKRSLSRNPDGAWAKFHFSLMSAVPQNCGGPLLVPPMPWRSPKPHRQESPPNRPAIIQIVYVVTEMF